MRIVLPIQQGGEDPSEMKKLDFYIPPPRYWPKGTPVVEVEDYLAKLCNNLRIDWQVHQIPEPTELPRDFGFDGICIGKCFLELARQFEPRTSHVHFREEKW